MIQNGKCEKHNDDKIGCLVLNGIICDEDKKSENNINSLSTYEA